MSKNDSIKEAGIDENADNVVNEKEIDAEEIEGSNDEEIKKDAGEKKKKDALLKEIEELKSASQAKEKEAADYLDKYRRVLAEMENLRKRTQADKQDFLKYANFNIVSDFLVILDDFQRAIDAGKDPNTDLESYVSGIELIEKQILDLLFKKYGVKKYGDPGEEFDPNIHQAVMMEEGDFDKEEIIEVFRKGYMLHDRVVRSAQVKVGKPIG
ncbi:MAG TPA: nucleotide exchange factor GrpE [Spirochaetota bacterium]|nr:nucleotide exchange factor GrpE [Spirochaetota bacterium]HOS32325.1 nucleotide exchange factor GrpE [Spirochaetota bacterium]HOS54422.1 nucleotide exchange factor GrpE [Spirochaetota bacterium]HPK61195.1 nucleotide exchange factor GrpE [Spirochaetota bacterium]HQF76915.1 nucleotide exchange factor GrpE [Spirochaetota bacterium]